MERPHTVLDELDKILNRQYNLTNQRIQSGDNSWVRLDKNGVFRIKTPNRFEQETPASLSSFFPKRHYVSLLEVLSTINRYSGFLEELQHWRQRYHRESPDNKLFYAGLIGLGCHIGTRKMAVISRNIDEASLENTVNWYFSWKTFRQPITVSYTSLRNWDCRIFIVSRISFTRPATGKNLLSEMNR